MKRILLVISAIFMVMHVVAQEDVTRDFTPENRTGNTLVTAPDNVNLAVPEFSGIAAPDDSLHLPTLNNFGQMRINMYPMEWGGMYNWDLHKGLNVSLGASVFAAFGKHAPHGAGFNHNIAAMYAVPLSSKLSFAVGGYFNNTSWLHNTYNDAGFNAVLGYKFDEHWEAYLYGQKSLLKKRMPLMIYDMNNVGDRIGAAVKYNFNPNFSVQVSVSTGERYWNDWWY